MSKGFTIIELVISIFILAIAVIGIFSAFSIVVILTSDAADRLTGTYLAQEGMEIVRNIRDTNWLKMDAEDPVSTTWLDKFNVCAQQGCEADYTSGLDSVESFSMSPWNSRSLYINSNGFYNYLDGVETKFKRKIIIVPVSNVDYVAKIFVQVSWLEKPNILNRERILAGSPDPKHPTDLFKCNPANCIMAEMTLYDWYNYIAPEEEPVPE